MDISKILVVVKFDGALIFLLWDIDYLGAWEIFGHVILVMGIFWTCDFGYGNFLDT